MSISFPEDDNPNDEYHPIHLHLSKPQIKKLAMGGAVRVQKTMCHEDDRHGGSLTYLPLPMAEKAKRALKSGKAFISDLIRHNLNTTFSLVVGGRKTSRILARKLSM